MTWFRCDTVVAHLDHSHPVVLRIPSHTGHEGHEGDEEKHEVDEGRQWGGASYENNEGDEG